MISNSDRISRKEEINELFEQLGQFLATKYPFWRLSITKKVKCEDDFRG